MSEQNARAMAIAEHTVKCWPEYFEAVISGRKQFEIRRNDRSYAEGDRITLREWDPATEAYSGRSAQFVIGYVTAFEQQPGFVVFSLSATADTARAQGRQDADIAKRKAVANCYMMAKREITRLRSGNAVDAISLERWQHVLRFCEESGEKSSILRDGLPTEITDGARATPGDTP